MSGIAGAADQHDKIADGKCARAGCEVREGAPHPVTGKNVACLKVAQAVRGKGVVQWCSRECWEVDNA